MLLRSFASLKLFWESYGEVMEQLLLPLLLLLFYLFFFLGDFGDWVLYFQESSTVYCYAMVDLHDLTMFYIHVVLGVVCWSLYVVLRSGFWHIANKSTGLTLWFYQSTFFPCVEASVVRHFLGAQAFVSALC